MKYFAYGSNMCTGRLQERVPSARPLFVACLAGHKLKFQKLSRKDCSAKADAEQTGDAADGVWGVVFQLDESEKVDLDAAEGLNRGYEEKEITLTDGHDQAHAAVMYFASESFKRPDLRPYSWYVRFVVEGAKQHGLPPDYIVVLEQTPSTEDLDRARDMENRQIRCQ